MYFNTLINFKKSKRALREPEGLEGSVWSFDIYFDSLGTLSCVILETYCLQQVTSISLNELFTIQDF